MKRLESFFVDRKKSLKALAPEYIHPLKLQRVKNRGEQQTL
jgi:hypothetical protein